jgi:hypothetical protein
VHKEVQDVLHVDFRQLSISICLSHENGDLRQSGYGLQDRAGKAQNLNIFRRVEVDEDQKDRHGNEHDQVHYERRMQVRRAGVLVGSNLSQSDYNERHKVHYADDELVPCQLQLLVCEINHKLWFIPQLVVVIGSVIQFV